MKVKCIDINIYTHCLTLGKIYNVIWVGNNYIIIDDDNEDWFPKEYFKTLSEIRNETINKLLEDES